MKTTPLLTLLLLAAIGCNGAPQQEAADDASTESKPDPIAGLVEDATREFDILAAPLEEVAKKLAAEMLAFQENYDLPPEIDWEGTRGKPKVFAKVDAAADNDLELQSVATETVYEITATRRTYDYQFSDVIQIVRTGKRETPFAATVAFEVTTTERAAELHRAEPTPSPDGFRLATPEEMESVDAFTMSVIEPEPYDMVMVQVGETGQIKRYSLPHSAHWRRDIESAPKAVRNAVDELTALCDAAEPTTSQSLVNVEFVYNRKRGTWEGQ